MLKSNRRRVVSTGCGESSARFDFHNDSFEHTHIVYVRTTRVRTDFKCFLMFVCTRQTTEINRSHRSDSTYVLSGRRNVRSNNKNEKKKKQTKQKYHKYVHVAGRKHGRCTQDRGVGQLGDADTFAVEFGDRLFDRVPGGGQRSSGDAARDVRQRRGHGDGRSEQVEPEELIPFGVHGLRLQMVGAVVP